MSNIKHAKGKERKFIELALGILNGKLMEEGVEGSIEDSIQDSIQDSAVVNASSQDIRNFIMAVSKDTGITYPAEYDGPKGSLHVVTYDGPDRRTPAQVKLWRLERQIKDDDSIWECLSGKISAIRLITDFDGELMQEIPYGKYYLEVSKGSEYCIIKDIIEIGPDKKNLIYHLKRFADLSRSGWYAGDLHHHSIYSSPVYKGDDDVTETPFEAANSMAAMGLRYGALSDHHNILNHKEWLDTKRDDFLPIISKEISTTNGHVMALMVDHDVIFNIPDDEHRTDEYMKAEFKRITDDIKKSGGLAQINHPCDSSRSTSWNPAYNDMLSIFETMEIWNGSRPMIKGSSNYKAYELWRTLLKEGTFIPATTGSDTHNIKADDYDDFYILMQDLREYMTEDRYPEHKDTIHVIDLLFEKAFPILEKWAKTSLTSGCVRTYVYVEGELTKEKILDSLRTGRSFLTDGPILFYKDKRVVIMSARPLRYLHIFTPEGLYKEIELDSPKALKKEDKNIYYDYSFDLNDIEMLKKDWFYLSVMDDCTNLAITNPVFRQN